jgi:plastocyanin
MRRGAVTLVVIAGLTALVLPAMAAQDATIVARSSAFVPEEVTIGVGETVTFDNEDALGHNFYFAELGQRYPASPLPASDPSWPQSRRFDAAGDYEFVCDAHPFMTGVVRVRAVAPAPTATPTPTPTSPPGAPAPGDEPVEVRALRTAGAVFCVKRSRLCRRPGVRVRIDLSRAAAVSGRLTRRARRFGRVDFGTVPAGPRTLRFTRTAGGRRLTPGRYRLALDVVDAGRRTLRFRVR